VIVEHEGRVEAGRVDGEAERRHGAGRRDVVAAPRARLSPYGQGASGGTWPASAQRASSKRAIRKS
jgi:hypothetical protein